MKTLSNTTAVALVLTLAACSPSPEAEDTEAAVPAVAAQPPAKAEEAVHEDDDAADPSADDHGHEHADGEDADHAH